MIHHKSHILPIDSGCESLNDNPRTRAAKRLTQLHRRRAWLIRYKSGGITLNHEGGEVSSLGINPYVRSKKAGELIARINREINATIGFIASI